MKNNLSEPLDDEELDRLDDFLLDRLDDETSDEIARAGGDEGILNVSELDGFLTAIVSGPNAIPPSTWLGAIWGAEEPVWESMEELQEIFGLIARHQNSIADFLLHDRQLYEPMFSERVTHGKAHLIVDEWCYGYMRGIELDAEAWAAGGSETEKLLQPIRLYGTEAGWREVDTMSDEDQARARNAIPQSVRALYAYWLERRTPQSAPIRRAAPKVGRNDPCPCGSGKKYKHCCLQ